MHILSLPNFLGRNYELFLQTYAERVTLARQNPLSQDVFRDG